MVSRGPRGLVLQCVLLLAVVVLGAVTNVPDASASSSAEWSVQLIEEMDRSDSVMPDVSGDRVVWWDSSGDVLMWTAGNPVVTVVPTISPLSFATEVSGDRVVWLGGGASYDEPVYTWAVGDPAATKLAYDGTAPHVSGDRVVWSRSGEIFTWAEGDVAVTQITSNGYADASPRVCGDSVVWSGQVDGDFEIFMWHSGDASPTRITTNEYDDYSPQISDSLIAWVGVCGPLSHYTGAATSEIFAWQSGDAQPTRITNNGWDEGAPRVSGDRVAWKGGPSSDPNDWLNSEEIFTWTSTSGEVTRVTNNVLEDANPDVSGDRIVWLGWDGSDYEVLTWAEGDSAPSRITDNTYKDHRPSMSGDRVAWFSEGPTPGEYTAYLKYESIAGASRYDTAIRTSKEAFEDGAADCVLIATGANWPDALGGAALAGAYNGPILLTYPTALSPGVIDEIRRLGAKDAYILGGVGAVSQAVEDALKGELGEAHVKRVWGASRYETAKAIAEETISKLEASGGYDGTAFVATAANFPDALAASPLAAAQGWPLFLCDPSGMPDVVAMTDLGVTHVLILGGTGAISEAQQAALEAAFPGRVERLSGVSRYATGVAVATYGVNVVGLTWDRLALSTGQNFPDALAGGMLSARNGSVMLLTASETLSVEVGRVLSTERESIGKLYYLGGLGAVSQTVRTQVQAIVD